MQVESVREVLDGLVAGRITLDQAADKFRKRRWPALPKTTDAQAWGVQDDTPAPDDSWDVVNSDSRLTAEQYQALSKAYGEATGNKVTAEADQPHLF